MPDAVKRTLLAAKTGDVEAKGLGAEIAAWLAMRGVGCRLAENRPGNPVLDPGDPAPDLVLVLGGDGTFISVARRFIPLGIPLLGINVGRVGFLAEVSRKRWGSVLHKVLAGRMALVRRMALVFSVIRNERTVHEGVAVNDLVVSRGTIARLARLGLACGDEIIHSFRADGLIVSTPTGATAYAVSAGGPLIHPDLRCFCITPICPFLTGIRPMVLPADEEIRITVQEATGDVNLTEDGQTLFELAAGDIVVVRQSPHDLLMVDAGSPSYFEKLAAKGFLTEK